jgi:hypothetical protein
VQRKGMVDALHEAHRVLAPRGLLIDARPDSRVYARAEHRVGSGRYVTAGIIRTSREELANDRASDRAVGTVKRQRLFRSVRRGKFWHPVPFDDLAGLEQYLTEHLRFEHRVRWHADAAKRRAWRGDPWAIRRAVRYEVLRRLEPPSAT